MSDSPAIFLMLGGQPGSGKSFISEDVGSVLREGYVYINVDDFRQEHPDYKKFCIEDDATAAEKTHKFAVARAGEALTDARNEGRDVFYDATLGNSKTAANFALEFKQSQYNVDVVVLAIHEDRSWISVLERYESQKSSIGYGRMVPKEVHDEAYRGLPETLRIFELKKCVNSIKIVNREKDIVYSNRLINEEWEHFPQAHIALQREREVPFSMDIYNDLIEIASFVLNQRKERRAEEKEISEAEELKSKFEKAGDDAIAFQKSNI